VGWLPWFVGVRVGVAYSRDKLAVRIRLRNLNVRSQFSIFYSFRDIHVQIYDFFEVCGRFVGVKVGVANFIHIHSGRGMGRYLA